MTWLRMVCWLIAQGAKASIDTPGLLMGALIMCYLGAWTACAMLGLPLWASAVAVSLTLVIFAGVIGLLGR